jgi:hypothetical protein
MTARRVPLAELDALTDRIEPLLARLDTIWRRVEAELRAQRTPTHGSRACAADGTARPLGAGQSGRGSDGMRRRAPITPSGGDST